MSKIHLLKLGRRMGKIPDSWPTKGWEKNNKNQYLAWFGLPNGLS